MLYTIPFDVGLCIKLESIVAEVRQLKSHVVPVAIGPNCVQQLSNPVFVLPRRGRPSGCIQFGTV